jgi:mono/diheme cytochrome c family protein
MYPRTNIDNYLEIMMRLPENRVKRTTKLAILGAMVLTANTTIEFAIAADAVVPTAVVGAADLKNGENVYLQACLPCHGDSGQGGQGGGAPLTSALTKSDVVTTVTEGRNAMPEFGSVFSEREINDVANFIVETLLK